MGPRGTAPCFSVQGSGQEASRFMHQSNKKTVVKIHQAFTLHWTLYLCWLF